MRRSALGVGRKSRERGSTFKTPRPVKRTGTPRGVLRLVVARDRGRCVWCRHEGRDVRAEHPHHLLPQQTWPWLAGVAANVVCLCAQCHMKHEFSPRDRLPWDALPVSCREFLTAMARADARAARLITVKYPKVNERSTDVRSSNDPDA